MGLLDSFKNFVHSVTTDDHYALYGSPYARSSAGGSIPDAAASTARLQELASSLTHSLVSSRNASSTNVLGYRPGMRSSATNVDAIPTSSGGHEMQTFATDGQPPLPSVDSLWERIERFLEEEYPELEDSLNSGVSTADLNEFEKDLAVGPLPVEVRQFYKRHDGQFRGGKPTGLLMGLTLLDMESIMEEYALWAKVAERVEKQRMALHHQQQRLNSEGDSSDQQARERMSNSYLMHQKSIPTDAVQPYYVHRGWIPIARDLVGNLIAIDMAPGPAGLKGQIILYGREFDTKVVIAMNLQELLFQFTSDLEMGNFEIDKSESNDDNGFLDSTRDDDYMIGDEDEDNGELSFLDRDGHEFGKNQKGKISYIEALKRRALKRYGVVNVESFRTDFTPQRIPRNIARPANGSTDKLSTPKTGSTTQLVNLESTTDLLKETLIDDGLEKKDAPAKTALETPAETSAKQPLDEEPASETKATEPVENSDKLSDAPEETKEAEPVLADL